MHTEHILGWDAIRIRNVFEKRGFILREWEKVQTDTLNIVNASEGRLPRPATANSAETSVSSAIESEEPSIVR